jgi:hypothetical protein
LRQTTSNGVRRTRYMPRHAGSARLFGRAITRRPARSSSGRCS